MVFLNLSGQGLFVLPAIPDNVTELRCDRNNLTALPPLLPALTRLGCSRNKLNVLPDLPLTLEALACNNNEITTLPVLPPTLTHLWCSNNQLTALPNLPPTLSVLSCENNQLTSLPDLPPRLSRFVCTNNRFSPDLQAILDRYARNLPQLIISVNQYNAQKLRRLRQTGRNILGLHMLQTRLPLQPYNMPQPPEVPNWLSERVMHTLTGIRTKNVARPNATGKIRPPGNLRETLKNLKRNYNALPGRRNRIRCSRKQTRRKQTRKTRRHK